MDFLQRNAGIGVLIAIVIAVGAYFYPSAAQIASNFGGVTNYDEVDATALKIGGSSGSRVGPIIAGTCALTGMDASASATTTSNYDCAVTGVVSGDTVFAQLATTTSSVPNSIVSFAALSAKASTTAGFITVRVANFSGTAVVPSTLQIGSSTNYLVLHPVTSVPGL